MTDRSAPPPDAALWEATVRGVAPLRRHGRTAAPAVAVTQPVTGTAPVPADRVTGLDRATAERLKRGLRTIEARLDLHGMTQAEAHRALAEFVRVSRMRGLRCLLVVTGRGLGREQPGILKAAVPRWLDEPQLRGEILAVAPARPRHGGAGALYLLLRRRR